MGNKYHHITWRQRFKRLDEDSSDIRKEYLLSQALVYFLGSALIAQASPPNRDYGFMTAVFEFVNDYRYIVAYVILAMALFLFYTALFPRPKGFKPFALVASLAGSFIPLVFFLVDLLRVVLELLKSSTNPLYAIIFYQLGFLMLSIALVWNLVTFVKRYKRLNTKLAKEAKETK